MNLLWLSLGLVLGLILIMTQQWTVNHLSPEAPDQALIYTFGGMTLRLLLATGFFSIVLRQGVLPVLLVLGGMWLMRWGYLGWLEINERRIS